MNGSLGCSDAKNFTLATDASQYGMGIFPMPYCSWGIWHSDAGIAAFIESQNQAALSEKGEQTKPIL